MSTVSEVKWNLQEIEVPTVEQSVPEDAHIRELGLGWAWFVNDLRAFLPAWQDMELATPSSEEPVTQIEADVPIAPMALHVDAMDLELALYSYERPLAVSPFGTPELVPDWQDAHAMSLSLRKCPQLGKWIRTDLGVCTYQGLGKNSPSREQVVRHITRDLHTHRLIESLECELRLQVPLHRRCLPGCGHATPYTRDIETCFFFRLQPRVIGPPLMPPLSLPSLLPSGGGGTSFSKLDTSVRSMMGSKTLSSMQRFIEDAEKECTVHDAELKVKDVQDAKQKETETRRHQGIEDAAHIKRQNEVDQETSSDSQEEPPVEDHLAEPLTGFSSTTVFFHSKNTKMR